MDKTKSEMQVRQQSICGCSVDITQNDIDDGKRGDPQYCPLSIAMRRVFPYWKIEVVSSGLYVDGVLFRISEKLAEDINKYDQGFEMYPSSICFTVKTPNLPMGNLIASNRVLTDMQIEEIKMNEMNEIPILES